MSRLAEAFAERTMEKATKREAHAFLIELTRPLIGARGSQVLIDDLIEDGFRGPLMDSGDPIETIETSQGWRVVSEDTWEEAVASFAQEGNWDLEAKGGAKTETKTEEGKSILISEVTVGRLGIARVVRREEHDSESRSLRRLGFKVIND